MSAAGGEIPTRIKRSVKYVPTNISIGTITARHLAAARNGAVTTNSPDTRTSIDREAASGVVQKISAVVLLPIGRCR